MNMHELQQKYRKSTDCLEAQQDPEFDDAFFEVQFFQKGDSGIFIVPPATRDFMYTFAMSTCTEDLNQKNDGLCVRTITAWRLRTYAMSHQKTFMFFQKRPSIKHGKGFTVQTKASMIFSQIKLIMI